MPRPPLPRPSRRLILTASFLLLAGAVVNVGVAWRHSIDLTMDELNHDHRFRNRYESWPTAVDATWPPPVRCTRLVSFATTLDQIRAYNPDGAGFGIDHCRTGWPLKSCKISFTLSQLKSDSPEVEIAPAPGLAGGLGWWHEGDDSRRWPSRVSLMPIAIGFAINTLFYATILALPLSFFPIRRRLRAGRGRCPKCGYDLAGLRGEAGKADAPCPECGAAR